MIALELELYCAGGGGSVRLARLVGFPPFASLSAPNTIRVVSHLVKPEEQLEAIALRIIDELQQGFEALCVNRSRGQVRACVVGERSRSAVVILTVHAQLTDCPKQAANWVRGGG